MHRASLAVKRGVHSSARIRATCTPFAPTKSTSSTSSNPPPTSDSYIPSSSINDNASVSSFIHFSDHSYCQRYRDPNLYTSRPSRRSRTRGRVRSLNLAEQSSVPSSGRSRASSTTEDSSSVENNNPGSARQNRQDMERAWGGGVSESFDNDIGKRTATNNLALLFPGTGSQYVGMGGFLLHSFPAARQVWEEAEEALGTFESWKKNLSLESEESMSQFELDKWPSWQKERDPGELRKVVFNGPQDELMRSSNAQPAILITSMMFLRTLEIEFGVSLANIASSLGGHSAGEYSAVTAGGAFSFSDAVRLTRLHGLLTSRTTQLSSLRPHMDRNAPPENRAQMSALIINPGRTHGEITEMVQRAQDERGVGFSVEVASFNSSAQVVLSGSAAGVLYASELLQQNEIAVRAADLPVAAPFHCSFMKPAATGMQLALERGVDIRESAKPIVSGVTSKLIKKPEEIKGHLKQQISTSVRWSSALDTLRANGTTHMLFCGPGKALANLARREVDRGYWKVRDGDEPLEVTTLASEDDFMDVPNSLIGSSAS